MSLVLSAHRSSDEATPDLEALRLVYAEWSRGDFGTRFDIYSDELEWGWSDEFPGLGGVVHDPELRSRRLREWLSPWAEWHVEPEEYRVRGEFVIVLCRYWGYGKASGARIDTLGAHLWTMRDGKAVRLEIFSNPRRALEAAGIE